MLEHLDELKEYKKIWYITIAVFDTDLEPNVPSIDNVINDYLFLSKKLDKSSFNWRYTPIIINNKYTIEKHIETFEIYVEGCICLEDYVNVSGYKLKPKSKMQERKGYCSCFLSNDIGAVFNSCLHLCKYCYSNGKIETVINNFKKHDDNSPFLIG